MQDTTRTLREALERVAPVGRHAIVIGEALRNGGLLDVPTDKDEFRAFVDGPLTHAARSLLGKESADKLKALILQLSQPASAGTTLTGTLPLTAPSPVSTPQAPVTGKAPTSATLAYGSNKSNKKEATLPYGGNEARKRIDVALIEADASVAEFVTEVLEKRDYRVFAPKRENLGSLLREMSIGLVVVGQRHDDVLATVRALDDPPPVVLVTNDVKKRPPGVVAVLPRDVSANLIEALDAAIRYGR